MLFQIEKLRILQKNVVDLPVVWVWGIQEFLNFFYVNDVSLNVRPPRVKIGLEKDNWKIPYHWLARRSEEWRGSYVGLDL